MSSFWITLIKLPFIVTLLAGFLLAQPSHQADWIWNSGEEKKSYHTGKSWVMQSYPSQLGFKQESGRILKLIRCNQGLCWLSGTWLETGFHRVFLKEKKQWLDPFDPGKHHTCHIMRHGMGTLSSINDLTLLWDAKLLNPEKTCGPRWEKSSKGPKGSWMATYFLLNNGDFPMSC